MNQQIVREVKVKNSLGLHTRPATMIVKLLQKASSSVFFTHGKTTINAKSIMSILILAARKNSKIKITVEGDDAEDVMECLVEAFDTQFGE
ncbi:MAG: ptsH3 [Chlamydiales bacterium]|nr:ptsH3 [Chlamydiales bacterium]